MVFSFNVSHALRQLNAMKERICELLEWDALALSERRPGLPPSFAPQTSTREHIADDIRNLYTAFLSLSSDLQHVLKRHDLVCTNDDRFEWCRQLADLGNRVSQLRITELFS